MAIDEQVDLLKRDVLGWTRWRNVYGKREYIDLSGANLTEAILSNADLHKADLIGANLSGAKLINANLTGAKLSDADLSGANLIDANLTGANLTGANLTGAKASKKTQWPTADFDFAARGVTIGYY